MQSDLEQVEITIEMAQHEVELMESYFRLRENKDFKKLVEDEYFAKHAARLVMLRSDSNIPDDARERILRSIDAIGQFRAFLIDIMRSGQQAQMAIGEAENTREELLGEAL